MASHSMTVEVCNLVQETKLLSQGLGWSYKYNSQAVLKWVEGSFCNPLQATAKGDRSLRIMIQWIVLQLWVLHHLRMTHLWFWNGRGTHRHNDMIISKCSRLWKFVRPKQRHAWLDLSAASGRNSVSLLLFEMCLLVIHNLTVLDLWLRNSLITICMYKEK